MVIDMVKRNIINKLQEEITQPEIDILLGPRQVGKTTILKQLQVCAERKGFRTAFIDLEQPQVLAGFNASDRAVVDMIKRSGQVVFIDEFQYLENASKIFKAIYDSGAKTKIFCSGSSSLEIHKHLKESLAGRRFTFKIHPLACGELKAHSKNYPLEMYLRYGGMPGLTATDSLERKQIILSELLSSYVLKDVKSLVKEENIKAFNHLMYLLAQDQGSLVSVHSLSNEINLSSKAVNRYLDILEGTYVNFRVYSFSTNLGNELKKSCKTYLYDLGMRNALLKDFSAISQRQDKGVLLESYVFLKLFGNITPNKEIKFWRTKEGDEVDFILLKDRKPIPIEVKSGLKDGELPRGLRKFLQRYTKIEKAFVVNENISEVVCQGSCAITFMTFEQFEDKFDL